MEKGRYKSTVPVKMRPIYEKAEILAGVLNNEETIIYLSAHRLALLDQKWLVLGRLFVSHLA